MDIKQALYLILSEMQLSYPKLNNQQVLELFLEYLSVHLRIRGYSICSPRIQEKTALLIEEVIFLMQHGEPFDYISSIAEELNSIRPRKYEESTTKSYANDLINSTTLIASRELVSNFVRHGDQYAYFCTESDLLSYRIALINSKIYNISAMVLFTSKNTSDQIDKESCWNANLWTPPCVVAKNKKAAKA